MKTEYLLNREMEHVLAALTPDNELVMRACLQTGLRVSDVHPTFCGSLNATEARLTSFQTACLVLGVPVPLRPGKAQFDPLERFRMASTSSEVNPTILRLPVFDSVTQKRLPIWSLFKFSHSARKVYAVELMDKYGDIRKVQKVLKHRYESTTLMYAMADSLLQKRLKKRRKS
jgi:hypothetical protein